MATDETTTILVVEDNPGDARLLREALREIEALRVDLHHVETLAAAIDALASCKFDVGLLDLHLPDASGLDVVRRVHEAAPETTLVVLSALNDEQLAVQSLHEGAQDYLVKGELDGSLLWRALRYAMERQHRQLELRNLSLVDDLTGLNNRKGFLRLATHHVRLASRRATPFLVGFVDLDGLKAINDTFGHQEGNRALVEAADVLRDSFRQSDILGRVGGDEFVVLITDASEHNVSVVADRVQGHVRARNADPERRYMLSLSVGIVASQTAPPPDLEHLMQQADALMYVQKQEKRAVRDLVGRAESADPLKELRDGADIVRIKRGRG